MVCGCNLSVCQSCRWPLRNLTTMQMASSITKTSQTAWGPWVTCRQRWSSSRSSSKSRWDVCIHLPGLCVWFSFLPQWLKHVLVIDGSFWGEEVWALEWCVWVCPTVMCSCVCTFFPVSLWGTNVCLWSWGHSRHFNRLINGPYTAGGGGSWVCVHGELESLVGIQLKSCVWLVFKIWDESSLYWFLP